MSDLRKDSSEATLICDYSLNDLNMLMMSNQEVDSPEGHSPQKGFSTDKFNQLTKLDEEEENVDFMQMFNQFQRTGKNTQMHTQNNDAYFNQEETGYEARSMSQDQQEMQAQAYHLQQQSLQAQPRPPKSAGKGNRNVRPSSATVSGSAGRFLSSQNKGLHYGGSFSGNNMQDQQSLTYAHQMNNYMMQNQVNTQQVSHRNGVMNPQPMLISQGSKPPLQKKKARPQSAAKNQMRPANELNCVTNFTFQKAKQNQNSRSYVPDSLKNTDKERLYEDKINLKKQLNEIMQENQILRTQVQTSNILVKKKEDAVQGMMAQMFTGNQGQNNQFDNYLDDFQKREIMHKVSSQQYSYIPKAKKGGVSAKDNNIMALKSKLKDVNDLLQRKDKELQDLKQTLKFTKIKEFETELALNVQESQRLRTMLERETQRQNIDPRIVLGLKQQITQYQQIIQNLQQNQYIEQENSENLNKKLILQMKKFAKLKDSRKKISERSQRLEKKVQVLQAKVNTLPQNASKAMLKGSSSSQAHSIDNQAQVQQMHQMQAQYAQKIQQQSTLIERLLSKMQQFGMQITDEELMAMQTQPIELDNIEECSMQDENDEAAQTLLVTVKIDKDITDEKQIPNFKFQSYDQLRDTLKRNFNINDDEFEIREKDSQTEINSSNIMDIFDPTIHFFKLDLLIGQGNGEEEEDGYEEDDFEEPLSETQYIDVVKEDQVKLGFSELKSIFQIKHVKSSDIVKFMLHDERDSEGKKVKKISIALLKKKLVERVGFSEEYSTLMARFLIEKPEGGQEKISKTPNYEKETLILRKDLTQSLLARVGQYQLFKGNVLNQMLRKVWNEFEVNLVELEENLRDQDEDDIGTLSLEQIYQVMRMNQIKTNNFEPEVTEFLQFLAMRHSDSLEAVDYEQLIKALNDEFSFIDDKKSKWAELDELNNILPEFEPSSEEDEMQSEPEEIPEPEEQEDSVRQSTKEQEQEQERDEQPSNSSDIQQNVLLEKVDEILMQIVKSLPENQKIKTLTACMMPFLKQVFDEESRRQYLIISQDSFIQFLLGQGHNQLGLELDQSHVVCLLHLLVQEDEIQMEKVQRTNSRYILFDEFIELVKTYMKKELIMKQSKDLGIHYDILSKESVEFLFQIRSSLMHETNINENSEDEVEDRGASSKKQKPVSLQVRDIFQRIISYKNIALKRGGGHGSQNVEVMDFEQMLDILFMRMGIRCPSNRSQEELKYLLCIDFKYMEMVMLVKFDKVMHDLDYISIDLLRQATDHSLDEQRKMNINALRRARDKQLANQKEMQNERHPDPHNLYSAAPKQELEMGVSQNSKQEKKRKRPDDKKQLLSKKIGSQSKNLISQQTSNPEQDDLKMKSKGNKLIVGGSLNADQLPRSGNEMYRVADFDNMNVNETDINQKVRKIDDSSEKSEDYEEDYIQDDIPIDEDDEDDDDGIISDNYLQIDERKPDSAVVKSNKNSHKFREHEQIISMDHSDDIQESGNIMDVRKTQEIDKSENEYEEIHDDNEDEEISADEEDEEIDMDENYGDEEDSEQQMLDDMIDQMQEDQDDEEDMQEQVEDEIRRQMELDELENGEDEDNYEEEYEEEEKEEMILNQMTEDRYRKNEKEISKSLKKSSQISQDRGLSGTKSGILHLNDQKNDSLDPFNLDQFDVQPRKEVIKSQSMSMRSEQIDYADRDYDVSDNKFEELKEATPKIELDESGAFKQSHKASVKSSIKSSIQKFDERSSQRQSQYSEQKFDERQSQRQSQPSAQKFSERGALRDSHQQSMKQSVKSSVQKFGDSGAQRESHQSIKSSVRSAAKMFENGAPKERETQNRGAIQKSSLKASMKSSVSNLHGTGDLKSNISNLEGSGAMIESYPQSVKKSKSRSKASESYIQSQLSMIKKESSRKSNVEEGPEQSERYSSNSGFAKAKAQSSRMSLQQSSHHSEMVRESKEKNKKSIMKQSFDQINMNEASGIKFNPSIHSRKQSSVKAMSKHSSIQKQSSKAGSKKGFKVQGNLFAGDDEESSEPNEEYSEEQYSQHNQIAQDIHAGISEVEDFAVKVPSQGNLKQSTDFFKPASNRYGSEMAKERQSKQSKTSVRSSIKSNVNKSKGIPVNGENSVQKIDDQYYIDDFEENEPKSTSKQPNMPAQGAAQIKNSQQVRQSKDFEYDDDDDDYEF